MPPFFIRLLTLTLGINLLPRFIHCDHHAMGEMGDTNQEQIRLPKPLAPRSSTRVFASNNNSIDQVQQTCGMQDEPARTAFRDMGSIHLRSREPETSSPSSASNSDNCQTPAGISCPLQADHEFFHFQEILLSRFALSCCSLRSQNVKLKPWRI